jgi:PLP dependent protein
MLADVQQRITAACFKMGRDSKSVTLIAVTKTRSVEQIKARVLEHGHVVLGENRVQEALPKMEVLPHAEWHLIGHLQSNKVRFCRDFKALHGVDNLKLLEEIAKRAQDWGRAPGIFLEINTGGEAQKHGATPQEAAGLVKAARDLGLTVRGLMTVAPQGEQLAKVAFSHLRELRDNLGVPDLSMGMSDDLELAIAAGATHVRVGRALFG